jgi:hypothetical protein
LGKGGQKMITIFIYLGLIFIFLVISFTCLKANKESLVATVAFSVLGSAALGGIGFGIWSSFFDEWEIETETTRQTIESYDDLSKEMILSGIIKETSDSIGRAEQVEMTRKPKDAYFIISGINPSHEVETKYTKIEVNHETWKTLQDYNKK